jgi:hypothetical protein
MLAPLMGLILLIGVYPKPFLDPIEPAAERVVRHLNDCSVDPAAIEEAAELGEPLVQGEACLKATSSASP